MVPIDLHFLFCFFSRQMLWSTRLLTSPVCCLGLGRSWTVALSRFFPEKKNKIKAVCCCWKLSWWKQSEGTKTEKSNQNNELKDVTPFHITQPCDPLKNIGVSSAKLHDISRLNERHRDSPYSSLGLISSTFSVSLLPALHILLFSQPAHTLKPEALCNAGTRFSQLWSDHYVPLWVTWWHSSVDELWPD